MSGQGAGGSPAPLRPGKAKARWPLPAALSKFKHTNPWAKLRSLEVLKLLPTSSKGPLAFITDKRVCTARINGDVGSGRILWSRQRVDLAVLHPESQQHRELLLSTIHSQLQLQHRNVARIYGTCDHGADILIIRPYFDGLPLRSYLEHRRSADRRAIIIDVAQGLLYLHSQDIVHGDVSMDNVLVARDGRHALMATSFSAHTATPPLTDASQASWTIFQWDSDASSSSESDPELDTVVRGRAERIFDVEPEGVVEPATAAGARAFLYSTDKPGDIFAFGHFVVETFTEISPFHRPSALEILRRAATHRRPRHPGVIALTRGLDKWLWRICKRCWPTGVDSPDSFTAQELVDALTIPRNDILICPFEWPEVELLTFIRKHVRQYAMNEITDLEKVAVGKDAEDGKYELRATCHRWRVRTVKIIPHWAHRRGNLRQNVYPELFVWCQLQHPNIAPLLGFCRNFDDVNCFVVPWMGGGTCLDYLREHPDANRLTIAIQVAEALAYLHGRVPPVRHARVQAHSVWMAEDGTAYLSNFDFQPQVYPEKGFDDSDTNSLFWAQRWMSPERGPITTQRDVFAFAMFLFEIYAGHPPFHRKHMIDIYYAYRDNIRPARPEHSQLTDDVWELMQRCWRTAPYRRPSMKTVSRRLLELATALDAAGSAD
ncbi:kinase-like protein [Auricularia subglabra TFB-10046 SS5]|uniref:Kinase-like protein n=1 Tax=Auricularia subglabra (strain TFB-10046 / SS5) TaxID=717982 RepID=J0DAE1_AURST|nr:kinase-like protein [Auricularia subglabra TFB-10046 SS5]